MADSNPSSELIAYASLSLLAGLVLTTWIRRHTSHPPNEIPGPRPLPIVGNLFLGEAQKQMAELSKEFGPIYSVNLFGTQALVVTSVEVARELFVSRYQTYTNRLPLKMIEMCNFQQGLLFQPNAHKHRQGRRFLLKGLAKRELERYRDILNDHMVSFLDNLLRSPDDFMDHINNFIAVFSLEMGYGHKAQGAADPLVKRSNEWVQNFVSTIGFGGHLINVLPWLEYIPSWVPGASFHKTASVWQKAADAFKQEAFDSVKASVESGDAKASVLSRALADFVYPFEEDAIVNTAGQILTGGHTTTCSLQTFMLAMTLYPTVQEKARAEVDRILGTDRLPTIEDWDRMPYMAAVVREVLRWHPVIPLLTRNPIKDDIYNGYFIPKDRMIIVNYWAMLHREDIFPHHAIFRPERWFELKISRSNDPFDIAFGFGRRVCPGRASTKETLFTAATAILSMFRISKAFDEHGKEITPPETFVGGGIVAPAPFQCKIEPRGRHVGELIEAWKGSM